MQAQYNYLDLFLLQKPTNYNFIIICFFFPRNDDTYDNDHQT